MQLCATEEKDFLYIMFFLLHCYHSNLKVTYDFTHKPLLNPTIFCKNQKLISGQFTSEDAGVSHTFLSKSIALSQSLLTTLNMRRRGVLQNVNNFLSRLFGFSHERHRSGA